LTVTKHRHRRQINTAWAAVLGLGLLTALGGRAAQAGATSVTTPGQLGPTVLTDPYPTGVVPASFTVAAGGNSLSFTATKAPGSVGFKSAVANGNDAPQFTPNSILEDTTAPGEPKVGNTPTGPLRIDFQTGVTGFGLYAQDFNRDTETFTLNVFNGAAQLGTFSFGPTPNGDPGTDPNDPRGNAVFVGALATGGDQITSATLSSLSFATGGGGQPNNGNNDFFFGPTQVQAPVPEASTLVSLGLGVLVCAGLALCARRRKVGGAGR